MTRSIGPSAVAPRSSSVLRWTGYCVLAAALAGAAFAWYVQRERTDEERARRAAWTVCTDLCALIYSAQLEALYGNPPTELRSMLEAVEARLDAGEFARARMEAGWVALLVGAGWRECDELPRALKRMEALERDAREQLEHPPGRLWTWIESGSPPDPQLVDEAHAGLARAKLADGDALGALWEATWLVARKERVQRGVVSDPVAFDPQSVRWTTFARHASSAHIDDLTGEILAAMSDDDGARAFLSEALRDAGPLGGLRGWQRSDALAQLARLARRGDSTDDAEALLRTALAVAPAESPNDPRIASLEYGLASVLHDQGPPRWAEALQLHERSFRTRRLLSCGDSDALVAHLNNYGLLAQLNGDLSVAEPLQSEALAMGRRLQPGDDVGMATMMNNVGMLRGELGDRNGAEALLLASLEMRRRLFPDGDSDLMQSLTNLAWHYQDDRDFHKVETFAREAVDVGRRIFADDDLQLAISIDCLATALTDLGRLEEAEQLTREALAMTLSVVDGANLDLAQTLDNLGWLLHLREKRAEAKVELTRGLEMRRALFAPDHESIRESLRHLAIVHEATQDFAAAKECRRAMLLQDLKGLPRTFNQALQTTRDLIDCAQLSGEFADIEEPLLAAAGTARLTPSLSNDDASLFEISLWQMYMAWSQQAMFGNPELDQEASAWLERALAEEAPRTDAAPK
jgi:tetratricopeptide (TPR) repeat protein